MNHSFEVYIDKLKHLNRAPSAYGYAPHKPVLLLSICHLYEQGHIRCNKIELDPELLITFKSIWEQIVTTNHKPIIALPFFHLRHEKFWHLVPHNGFEDILSRERSINSISKLTTLVDYAYLDDNLHQFLLVPDKRVVFEQTLLKTYFSDTASLYQPNDISISQQLQMITEAEPSITESGIEEENLYIRDANFKREIPRIYNFTCAISGLRVTSTDTNVTMIDACHIVPFAETHDDRLGNGIALCPNLHRAFDRGLISISDEYTILINRHFVEDTSSAFCLSQFAGQQIKLPYSQKLYPLQENLAMHRRKWGF